MASKPLYLNKGRGRGISKHDGNVNPYNQNVNICKTKFQGRKNVSDISNGAFAKASIDTKGHGDQLHKLKLAETRFQKASAKHQESVQQFLNQEETCESSEEEEELESDNILASVFKSYKKSTTSDLTRTEQLVLDSFKSGSSVCLICIASIKRIDAIWSCQGCYCLFHIQCIQKWVKDGAYQASILSDEHFPKKNIPWFCPKCRYQYSQSECPTKYTCFCGKELEPKFDPWLVPHSCGNLCGKPLQPICGHDCLLLCHPGPCPPCPQTISISCHCKSSKAKLIRCGVKEWSCGKPCLKLLGCGHHKCAIPCHTGPCPTCPKQSSQKCLCDREASLKPCSSPEWKCKKVCNKPLSCGHHKCEIICHKGECGPCPRGGERTCPCGKTKFQLPCTEDVPTCGDTCNKQLDCKVHRCSQRCHLGPCGMCFQMLEKKCRCALREKSMPCHKEYLCETKCKNLRDCQHHACNRKCCDGNCPPCEQLCGKTLSCRNHKCASRCHSGPCYPCLVAVDISCFCGSNSITIPCGKAKAAKPPKCKELCRIPPDCCHTNRLPHKCHFNRCPPCKQVCNKVLPGCNHQCPILCHTAVLVKLCEKIQRAGPWEPKPQATFEMITRPCPPCKVPTQIQCLGKHKVIETDCSSVKPFSCQNKCDRKLACGNHTCPLECHEVVGAANNVLGGDNCHKCKEMCSLPRLKSCNHICLLSCHPAPCPNCKQTIKIRCHCQVNLLFVKCHIWNNVDDNTKLELTSCKNPCPKEISCGHPCMFKCHSGSCSNSNQCIKKVTMRCPCKKRKKELPCNQVSSGKVSVECDSFCHQLKEQDKKLKDEEAQRKKDEEIKHQQEELEKFERKLQGKKRKPRKQKMETVEKSPWFNYSLILISVLTVILAAFIYILISGHTNPRPIDFED